METSQHLFKELEEAEKLFSDGSIKNAQKIIRNVLKESRTLSKIPNKLCFYEQNVHIMSSPGSNLRK